MPNYFQSGPVVFDKKTFIFFLLATMATRILHGIEIIAVKFGEILPSSLEYVV